jgi:molybdopterin-binding protein
VAAVTRESAEELGLKAGDEAVALVKATSVMVGKAD